MRVDVDAHRVGRGHPELRGPRGRGAEGARRARRSAGDGREDERGGRDSRGWSGVMHDLNEIQSFMAEAVRELAPLEENAGISAKAPAIAAGNPRLSPIAQLANYREQFWLP